MLAYRNMFPTLSMNPPADLAVDLGHGLDEDVFVAPVHPNGGHDAPVKPTASQAALLERMRQDTGANMQLLYMVTGLAGTGKSFVLKEMEKEWKKKGGKGRQPQLPKERPERVAKIKKEETAKAMEVNLYI